MHLIMHLSMHVIMHPSWLSLSTRTWKRFESKIDGLIACRPDPVAPRQGKCFMLVLCGLPGAGKSYFAKNLVDSGMTRGMMCRTVLLSFLFPFSSFFFLLLIFLRFVQLPIGSESTKMK